MLNFHFFKYNAKYFPQKAEAGVFLCSVCGSCCHAGNAVSIQQRSFDDHSLLPLHVHGVRSFPVALVLGVLTSLGSDGGVFSSFRVFGGYFAGRLYRTLKGHRWRKGAFCVSLLSWTSELQPSQTLGLHVFFIFFCRRRLCTPAWFLESASS